MSKITRNDPCPCGSGMKYKHCCINKELPEFGDNDLFMVSSYGSEAYGKDELDKYGRFFVETQADEKFEIRKAEQGYIVKDIVPPEITMPVKGYRTVELNDIQRQKLIKHNPQYGFLTIGSHNYFDGIAEDGHFTWDGADGSTSSKGKISRLYIKQALGNYLLNVNLFPEKGEFKSIDEFLLTGLSIYTEINKYDFPCRDGKLFFEDSHWEYDGDGYETPFFVILLLQGLEQDQEQPLAKAIVQTLKREFAEEPASRERARDALEDMMPEIRDKYYTLVEDKEGKQALEKIYPPLKMVKK